MGISSSIARDRFLSLSFGSDAKKCQQAFLVPLPGKALVYKILVGHVHDDMHAW